VLYRWIPIVVAATVLAMAGCRGEQEQVQAETVAVAAEFADILETIKTGDDLRAAQPRLEKLGGRLNRLNKRKKDLPVSAQDQVDAYAKTAMAADRARAQQQMARIVKSLGVGAAAGIQRTVQMEAARISPY
jgi:hypothetical protein